MAVKIATAIQMYEFLFIAEGLRGFFRTFTRSLFATKFARLIIAPFFSLLRIVYVHILALILPAALLL